MRIFSFFPLLATTLILAACPTPSVPVGPMAVSPSRPPSNFLAPSAPTDAGGTTNEVAAAAPSTPQGPSDKSDDSDKTGSTDTTDKAPPNTPPNTTQDTPNTIVSATMPIPGKPGACDNVKKEGLSVNLTGLAATYVGLLSGTDNIKVRVEGHVDTVITKPGTQSVLIALDTAFTHLPNWKISTDKDNHFIADITYISNTTFYLEALVCDVASPCQQVTISDDMTHPMVFTSCPVTLNPDIPSTIKPPADEGDATVDHPIKGRHDEEPPPPHHKDNYFY